MKKLFLLVVGLCSVSAFANEKFYYDQPVRLTGKLSSVKSIHPNPEYGGKLQPAIFLTKPIDVLAGEQDSYNESEFNINRIQLAFGSDVTKKIKAYKNKKVSILCSDLFHSHTAHHTTEVLCMVKDISLQK